MNRKSTTLVTLLLVSFMAVLPLLGKTYRFELPRDTALNGVNLDAGVYQLKLNSTLTKAEIYERGKLAVTAQVEVKPLGNSTKDTILISRNGALSEYRSEREKICFVNTASQDLSSGF